MVTVRTGQATQIYPSWQSMDGLGQLWQTIAGLDRISTFAVRIYKKRRLHMFLLITFKLHVSEMSKMLTL